MDVVKQLLIQGVLGMSVEKQKSDFADLQAAQESTTSFLTDGDWKR